MDETLEANAILRGGPQPIGDRHVVTDPGADEYRVRAADGSGEHVWKRSGRFEPRINGGVLRVFVYEGPA